MILKGSVYILNKKLYDNDNVETNKSNNKSDDTAFNIEKNINPNFVSPPIIMHKILKNNQPKTTLTEKEEKIFPKNVHFKPSILSNNHLNRRSTILNGSGINSLHTSGNSTQSATSRRNSKTIQKEIISTSKYGNLIEPKNFEINGVQRVKPLDNEPKILTEIVSDPIPGYYVSKTLLPGDNFAEIALANYVIRYKNLILFM